MIKIVKPKDLEQIQDMNILPYICNLLFHVLNEYAKFCPDLSIEDEIGAIFLLERATDWQLFEEMGLSSPITESRFEWIELIECGYCNGCIVIDNDKAINIIGKQEYFLKFKGAFS